MRFRDRQEAGKLLAEKLLSYKNGVVLALPRGGVPVAAEVAKRLKLPLNVIVVRKIASRHQPEYGLGAISEANTKVLDHKRIVEAGLQEKDLDKVIKDEKKELDRRIKLYRNNKKLDIFNKDIILVDDGLATGVSARAAAIAAKKLGARKIIFAAPVCAVKSIAELEKYADQVVCFSMQEELGAIGNFYKNFEQVGDEAVIRNLQEQQEPKPKESLQ